MKKNYFWLTYDLGIDGDYDGLYVWLDGVKARECGDSAAYFFFDPGAKAAPDAILAAIKKSTKLRSKDRIYLIWQKTDGKSSGKFIAGLRRRPPWAGFAVDTEGGEDVAE